MILITFHPGNSCVLFFFRMGDFLWLLAKLFFFCLFFHRMYLDHILKRCCKPNYAIVM